MRRLLPALVVLPATALALFVAGCEKGEPDGSVPDGTAEATPIAFIKAGGIGGVAQRLVISANGDTVASFAAGDPLIPIEADPELVATARQHLSALDFANLGLPPGQPAPDEFTYSITYGDEHVIGGETKLRENQELSQAIGALDAILAAADESEPTPKR